ncbi:MAG TPA: hypothetical protein DCM26_03205 [Desulfotomaculum sp.]|jgi:mRNA-degrading endonuclease RelE of RelBE toxin-antitoxin system|nr:hypothetical protein [Desulfotomaculum sp.]
MNSKEGLGFKIVFDKHTAKYIEKLDNKWRAKILSILEDMVINPFSGDIETIKGKPGYYRRRVGRYRIKFTVLLEKREILILEFGTKGDFSY